jgi:hypothetical protein
MVERVHRQLKEGLAARGVDTDWPDHLPWVLLNIRSTPKSDSNISAAEMVFGAPITLPAQPAAPAETPVAEVERQRAGQAIPTRSATRSPPDKVPHHLPQATMMYVRKGAKGPLALPYSGPYKVLCKGPKVFLIEVGGVEQIVTVDGLKPTANPATPPKRGHPPATRAAPAVQEAPADPGNKENRPPTETAAAPAPPAVRTAPAAPTARRDAREQSLGLPATTSARPAREQRRPARLDL